MTFLTLLLISSLTIAQESLAQRAGDQTVATVGQVTNPIARALALLGRQEQPVVLFDPSDYDAAHRAKLERFEAFVFKERREIYLNRRGRAYSDALADKPEGVYVLAAILAHELAHLHGKDERHALQAEQACVYEFMKQGRISVDTALAHLRGAWALR